MSAGAGLSAGAFCRLDRARIGSARAEIPAEIRYAGQVPPIAAAPSRS